MLLRPTYLAFALSAMLAGCSDGAAPPTALAPSSPDLAKATVTRSEVTFTLPAGTCGLTTDVTGTGVFQAVVRELEVRGGEVRIALSESYHGSATGDDGSQYRFNYSANYEIVEVLDPSGLPLVIDVVDHFNLLGQAGAPDSKMFIHGQFLFDGSLPLTPIGSPTIRGDLNCDPV